jgi:serine/threonine protein kinase
VLTRALDRTGVCQARSTRRINGYKLETKLGEGPLYQDYIATHPALKLTRRVRLYPYPPGASQELRQTIRRAAEREFRALEHVTHTSLLKPLEFQDSDFGPSLLFPDPAGSMRLDQFLRARHATLPLEERVHLIRQVAEAIRFAHDNRRIHCALSPQCILVRNPDAPLPEVQVMNWHTGSRIGEATTGTPSVLGPTSHMSDLVDEGQTVYQAPESNQSGELTEAADVFSLGAISYFVLTGQPPARTALDLAERLRRGGLLLSDVIDGPNQMLLEMVREATQGAIGARCDLEDILAALDLWEETVTAPDPGPRLNPADASAGDELGEFKVERRLGTGATAVALQVRHDNERLVLKVAVGPDFNERVRAEGQVLQKLHNDRIVGIREIRDVEPVTLLVLEHAGERTLAKWLKDEGRLSLEFLQRFGGDLLEAVDYLEQKGIWHRDIKPDNIGIAPFGRSDQLRLVLFDFSLARTSLDQIRAGTPGYLDPFIALRQPPRYDLQAERFAAAVTLYEMATGRLPVWGDGSDPAQLECEATIDTDLMDAPVREGLASFFRRALARRASDRFDNGAEMRDAWQRVFTVAEPARVEGREAAPASTGHFDKTLVEAATLDTPIDQLGISVRGVNALERMGCSTLRDMLRRSSTEVFAMRGVGNKTRRELGEAYETYRRRFPSVDLVTPTPADESESDHGHASLDTIFSRLLIAKEKDAEAGAAANILQHILGLDGEPYSIPSQTDVAGRVGVTRAYVSLLLQKPRNRWAKDGAITALRRELAELIAAAGGVMGIRELAVAIAERRGSLEHGDARLRRAVAVLRAGVEAEDTLKEPRFAFHRRDDRVVVAVSTEHASYAFALGDRADTLATAELLLPASRSVEELRSVASSSAISLDDSRLVRLAAAASARAAVSPRLEIYPRGMNAERTAKICNNLAPSVGSDNRSEQFSVDDVRARVAGRFPEAEPLPDRPELDDLLQRADWNVRWDPDAANGAGAYCARVAPVASTSDNTISWRPTVLHVTALPVDEEALAARRFDERLRAAAHHGGFLVLTVPEKYYLRAERQLARQFGVRPVDLDGSLIRAMRDVAAAGKVRWDVVLKTDRDPTSPNWQRLQSIAQRALARVTEQIPKTAPPALLISPGLLQRYGQLPWLGDLAVTVGRAGGLHGAWLLVPWEDPTTPPALGDEAIPMLPSQRAHVPAGWLGNRHRAA